MKIAYLTSMYPYATDTFVRVEVTKLRQMGFDVHPFSIKRPDASLMIDDAIRTEAQLTGYLFNAGLFRLLCEALAVAVRRPWRMLTALKLLWCTGDTGLANRLRQCSYLLEAAMLSRIISERGIGHLHNHIGENSATVAMLAGHITGIPYSLTIHGPGIFFHPRQWALGEKIRRSAFTACISAFCRSQCMIFTPPEAWSKLRVVRCAVADLFTSTSNGTPSTVPRLVCVGRLCPAKGQLQLVDAAERLRERGIAFEVVLVGDGELRGQIESRVREADLGDCFRMTGWLDSQGVRDQLMGARALVLPSFAEGLPVVLMEAMAMQRPVIATRIAGIPELVEDGVSGWLVAPSSLQELTEAMYQALTAPVATLQGMGRSGSKRVSLLHDADAEVEKLAGYIRMGVQQAGQSSRGQRCQRPASTLSAIGR